MKRVVFITSAAVMAILENSAVASGGLVYGHGEGKTGLEGRVLVGDIVASVTETFLEATTKYLSAAIQVIGRSALMPAHSLSHWV